MTAYKDIDSINNFVAHTPKEWGVYIHLDKKSKILPKDIKDINNRAQVFSWYRIYWGSVQHLKAIWRLISYACKHNSYDYFHIVSGQDYFASDPVFFDQILGEEHNNYIGITNIPAEGWYWGDGGFDIFKYRYLSSFGDFRKPFWNKVNRKYKTFQKLCHIERKLPSYPLAKGFVWCSLHKDFINWAINSSLSKDLLKKLNNSIVAEEVFFQTLIINSPYKNSIINNSKHFHNWISPWPKILDITDLKCIIDRGYLFCRKIDSIKSNELIERINTATNL